MDIVSCMLKSFVLFGCRDHDDYRKIRTLNAGYVHDFDFVWGGVMDNRFDAVEMFLKNPEKLTESLAHIMKHISANYIFYTLFLKKHFRDYDVFIDEDSHKHISRLSMKVHHEKSDTQVTMDVREFLRIFPEKTTDVIRKYVNHSKEAKELIMEIFFYHISSCDLVERHHADQIRVLATDNLFGVPNNEVTPELFGLEHEDRELYDTFMEKFRKYCSIEKETGYLETMKLLNDQSTPVNTPEIEETLSRYEAAVKQFLAEYGGVVTGGAALAFFNRNYIPDDIDVIVNDNNLFDRICVELSQYEVEFDIGYDDPDIYAVRYFKFMGVKLNLIVVTEGVTSESHIASFDMDCCKLIYDPSLGDKFSRSSYFALKSAIERRTTITIDYVDTSYPSCSHYNICYHSNYTKLGRMLKYKNRGIDITVVTGKAHHYEKKRDEVFHVLHFGKYSAVYTGYDYLGNKCGIKCESHGNKCLGNKCENLKKKPFPNEEMIHEHVQKNYSDKSDEDREYIKLLYIEYGMNITIV